MSQLRAKRAVVLGPICLTGLAVLLILALNNCSTAQLSAFSSSAARVEPALAAACVTATSLATVAGLVPGVGAILPYITVGCSTAEGLARLAADPSSVEWVGQLSGQIKALAAPTGLKL